MNLPDSGPWPPTAADMLAVKQKVSSDTHVWSAPVGGQLIENVLSPIPSRMRSASARRHFCNDGISDLIGSVLNDVDMDVIVLRARKFAVAGFRAAGMSAEQVAA